jgi:hypothetical protein
MYGIFGRKITIHTVIYGANVRFWPTLHVRQSLLFPLSLLASFTVMQKLLLCRQACARVGNSIMHQNSIRWPTGSKSFYKGAL